MVSNHDGNPYMKPEDMHQGVFKFCSDNTAKIMGMFNLPGKWTLQTQTMFNDEACKEYMNVLMLKKEWRDNSFEISS